MKAVVVGDLYVSTENLKKAALALDLDVTEVIEIEWKLKDKEDFQQRQKKIESFGPEAEPVPDGLLDAMSEADILLVHFAPIPRKIIEAGHRLKLIGTCRGGLEHIDVEAAFERRIPVINAIRNAEPVADFTLGLIYSETRNIARSHHAIKLGKWQKDFYNSSITTNLNRLTVGIVGLGNIGRLVARKLNALGVGVIGYDPAISAATLQEQEMNIKIETLEGLFQSADIVTLHVRLTNETENMVDERLLSLMKPTAYLINTSRAGILDEQAIVNALKNKKIAGAALDVFWEEPLAPDHPLVHLDNVTLTTHLAGDTVDAIPKSPEILKDNINQQLKNGSVSLK